MSVTERRTLRTRFSDGTRSPMASGVQSCSVASSAVSSPCPGGACAAAASRRREAAGGEQEAGVADHPVVGADGEALDVPVADHRLPGLGSLKEPISRMDSTPESWVVVAT